MESASYTTLSRQSGLLREMQVIANNIANAQTTGFKQEGVIFSEYVTSGDGGESISMADARVGKTSYLQGNLEPTGGSFDLAIEGEGYFLIDSNGEQRLTRAGAFSPSSVGTLVTMDGHAVLDEGGSPIFVPPGAADLFVAQDGTLSADGVPLGKVGVVRPNDPNGMIRESGVMFRADGGYEPVENPHVMQGFTEASNVDTILQMARMVEVQRAYEMGQSFVEREDERIRNALKSFVK
ncbi:MAG: flagellar hook-basal body complex protein [Pelagimonas sp.]